MEGNEYLLTVLRYVERNPLRANLVDSADQWSWSSMRTRLGTPVVRPVNYPRIEKPPIELPALWRDDVQIATDKGKEKLEVSRIRKSVETGLPYGSSDWLNKVVKVLGLESLLNPKGRPKKEMQE